MSSRYLNLPLRWLRPETDAVPNCGNVEANTEANAAGSPGVLNLEAVYAEHRDALWSFSLRLLADPASAEDLVHDVFVALPKLWHKVGADTPLRSFLLAVTANLARNHSRSAKRRRLLAEVWGRETSTTTSEHPEHLTLRRNLAAQLEAALSHLSHDHRVVFVLVEIEQYSALEAAEILDLPPGTVRSRMFHAKRQLQARLWNSQESA